MRYFWKTMAALTTLGAAACGESGGPTGPSLNLAVAPLTLPGMTDVCYGLTVYNKTTAPFAPGDVVWSEPSLCASDYGSGGGIRFTGICDGQAPGEGHRNAIRLVLNDIFTGGAFDGGGAALASAFTSPAGDDYVNPCPPAADGVDNGCVLTAPCEANTDSAVEFNLTVMRNASLGFFDTVVKFQDLFCSAKLDCQDQDGEDLLYLPKGGVDSQTAVLAFACTGGPGSTETYLYLDDVVVTCRVAGSITRTATVDPSGGPGAVTPVETGTDILFGASVNRGAGLQGATYWNVLLGLNLNGVAGETCTLTTTGTASDVALTEGATPEHTRYPVIRWDVDLSAASARTCTRHPLNNSGGDVATDYTTIDTPAVLQYQLVRSSNQASRVGISAQTLYAPYNSGFASRVADKNEYAANYAAQFNAYHLWSLENLPSDEDKSDALAEVNTLIGEVQQLKQLQISTKSQLDVQYQGWVLTYPTLSVSLQAAQAAALQAHTGFIQGLDALLDNLAQLSQFIGSLTAPPAPKMMTSASSGYMNQTVSIIAGSNTLYFPYVSGGTQRLWKTDGTVAGTALANTIGYGTFGSPAVIGDTVYFAGQDAVYGNELWKSDGTEAGTVIVKDILPGADSYPGYLTNVGGTLFFTAYNVTNGFELWKSDGTANGTVMVKDIRPGTGTGTNSFFSYIAFAGKLYFAANDGVTGWELWVSDGTAGGTVLVKDIQSGPGGSYPGQLTVVGGRLFFFADDGVHGEELWTTDGTANGTLWVGTEIRPGANSASPGASAAVGNTLFFAAYDGVHGTELWKSDGTAAGTVLVKDIRVGAGSSEVQELKAYNGLLYFQAWDGVNGQELWKSDGTEAGTLMVKDIFPGGGGATVAYLTELGGLLYFRAQDGVNGYQLWKSNGTAAGTVMVKNIAANGSDLNTLTAFGGSLFFNATDGINNRQLWKYTP